MPLPRGSALSPLPTFKVGSGDGADETSFLTSATKCSSKSRKCIVKSVSYRDRLYTTSTPTTYL